MINKNMVSIMYDPSSDGMLHLKDFISPEELSIIMKEIFNNKHLFEKKEEKYIENNQDVALIYRGEFDLDGLNNTIFENLFKRYLEIREAINEHSEIPFTQGNILEAKIIRYPVSKMGVAPHRDLSSNINMITFFNLFGKVNFYTYKDKNGNKLKTYLMKAGDVSLMRGQRNEEEEDIRPLHGVEEVTEERVVLAIREIRTDLEEITNKGNWRGF